MNRNPFYRIVCGCVYHSAIRGPAWMCRWHFEYAYMRQHRSPEIMPKGEPRADPFFYNNPIIIIDYAT